MKLDYDPIPVLESVGYTEREAAFLYLVAVHSGYFLRRQYGRFVHRERGAIAEQLLRKAAALGHIQSVACGQSRFVYHLASQEVYSAVGLATSRHRRLKGDGQIKCRLMVLDFILDHLGETILDSADAKLDFFTVTLGLSATLLRSPAPEAQVSFPKSSLSWPENSSRSALPFLTRALSLRAPLKVSCAGIALSSPRSPASSCFISPTRTGTSSGRQRSLQPFIRRLGRLALRR